MFFYLFSLGQTKVLKLVRLCPDEFKALADYRASQVFKKNPKTLPVRKLRVIPAFAREVGVNLDDVPDVTYKYKRRPVVIRRKRLRVIFGLLAGIHHQNVPAALRPTLSPRPRFKELFMLLVQNFF